MSRFFAVVLLSGALSVPVAIQAQDHNDNQNKRYYDSTHNDYHEWNANEDQAYHQYLRDHHKKDHDFSKASKREQKDYWNYRHNHQDSH